MLSAYQKVNYAATLMTLRLPLLDTAYIEKTEIVGVEA
jgi:hypothetical protein